MATETPFLKLRKTASADLVDVRKDVSNNLIRIDDELGEIFDVPWQTFNNPVSNVAVRVIRSKYKKLGNLLIYQTNLELAAVPTGTIEVNLPPGCSFAERIVKSTTSMPGSIVGKCYGSNNAKGIICAFSNNSARIFGDNTVAWNATVPHIWAVGHDLTFSIRALVG